MEQCKEWDVKWKQIVHLAAIMACIVAVEEQHLLVEDLCIVCVLECTSDHHSGENKVV